MNVQPIVRSTLAAACSGFLARPCCVVPAALSLAGIGSAGLSAVIVAHRSSFLAASAILLLISTWMNLRSGDTIVWTRASREDGSVEVHVYVLNSGRLQRVTFDLATVPTTSHAGSYAITASAAADADYTITFKSGWRMAVNPLSDGKRGAETPGLAAAASAPEKH